MHLEFQRRGAEAQRRCDTESEENPRRFREGIHPYCGYFHGRLWALKSLSELCVLSGERIGESLAAFF
ncbi:hypothetical protein SCG7109_BF_00060 [Chlamydiales bacterium SCGC AG-110-M15]|nr:hypothetical protein SCG7109_BF_00060 [Chlamydiales bacterium SCGC AG-110-M15]